MTINGEKFNLTQIKKSFKFTSLFMYVSMHSSIINEYKEGEGTTGKIFILFAKKKNMYSNKLSMSLVIDSIVS